MPQRWRDLQNPQNSEESFFNILVSIVSTTPIQSTMLFQGSITRVIRTPPSRLHVVSIFPRRHASHLATRSACSMLLLAPHSALQTSPVAKATAAAAAAAATRTFASSREAEAVVGELQDLFAAPRPPPNSPRGSPIFIASFIESSPSEPNLSSLLLPLAPPPPNF